MSLEADAHALMTNEAFVAAVTSCQQWHLKQAMECDAKDDIGRRIHLEHAKNVHRIVSHIQALVVATEAGNQPDPAQYYEEQAKSRFAALAALLKP